MISQKLQSLLLFLRQFLECGPAGQFLFREPLVFLLFQRIQFVKQPRGGKSQRCARFAGGPNVHQPVQRVFLLLDAQFVARRARRAFAAAKPAALVKNHRLDRGKQFGAGHQADRHARPAEDGLDDFAVRIVRDDDAVLDRITADNAAGRNAQVEDRIVGRGKLMNEFFGRRAAVPDAGIAFLQNHHATAFDARCRRNPRRR